MTEPRGDLGEAIDFLRHWKPEGPWVLTYIAPDQKEIGSETFVEADNSRLLSWLADRVGRYNLYFTVNPLLRPMSGVGAKAKKTDVRGMAWLHVDVDPRPREDLASERERALRLLRAFKPAPTVIVDSGGGYQGFWRLEEEQATNGDVSRAAELEAYNLQIELLMMGGSQTFNIDRIMRLPGTINLPNEKKRKAGRVAAEAHVVEADWSRVYPLTAFTSAPRVQARNGGGGTTSGPKVQLSGNLQSINLDDLPNTVSLRTKMLIVQGDDPDDPTRYPSRSEVCFAVCCELVRAGCSDDVIGAIILDKDFGISGHVLHQPRPQEYAARQIKRAREEAINPWLRRLNEEHAIIEDIGGKCRVISETYDAALKRSRISRQSFDDFRNRYMHIHVVLGVDAEGKEIKVKLGSFWLANPSRRQYKNLVFAPGRETPDSYNLWRGFSCEARPGSCEKFLSHVKENVCGGVDLNYEYLLNWMARAVQKPDEPGEVSIVLRGRMGTGKGKFAKVFGSLWGRHFLQVSDPKYIVGSFNAHLRDCVVLFGDEAFYAGDKRHESILKTLITEEIAMIEGKGVDVEPAPNYVHLILCSNNDWVVPAGADERRFFVLDVSDAHAQEPEYFAAIDEEMDNGGREALLHFLMTRPLKGYQVRTVPRTAALNDQKILSIGPLEEWWFEKLSDGKIGRKERWVNEITKDELHADLTRYLDRQRILRRPSPTAVAKFLGKVMPRGLPRSYQGMSEVEWEDEFREVRSKRVRTYLYEVATLAESRLGWERRFDTKVDWLPDESDQGTLPEREPF